MMRIIIIIISSIGDCLYTTDFSHCTETCHLQRFSDVVDGCISGFGEMMHQPVVDSFVMWSEWNHLQ